MILEGNTRGYGQELAFHLLNTRDNDHVSVHGIDGFVGNDLRDAFAEAEAIAQATQCQKYLYSLSLNPPSEASLSEAEFEDVIGRVERTLGLDGQPHAVVFHEKNGRRHAHAVWSRIDTTEMKAIALPHDRRKLFALSREIFLERGWDLPKGYAQRSDRDPFKYTRQEAQQAKRSDLDAAQLKAMFAACWASSDSGPAFAAALKDQGFVLAKGDRRGLVGVDADGKIWSLSRWCGVKSKDLTQRIGDRDALPDVEGAKRLAQGLRIAPDLSAKAVDPAKRRELVETQRKERARLLAAQDARRAVELSDRPKGLRKAFLRVTGQYKSHVARCEALAQDAAARDAAERQAMIDRHLADRRAIEVELGLKAAVQKPRLGLKDQRDSTEPTKASLLQNPAQVLQTLTYHKASFGRGDIMRALAAKIDEQQALQAATTRALASPDLVALPGDGVGRYTTLDYQRSEARLQASAQGLARSRGPRVAQRHVADALNRRNAEMKRAFGGSLSHEQTSAIKHVLGPEQLSQVVGLAGAGKSTMLETANDAWQRQGLTVHGAALSGKAAEGLQASSGIQSRTLAALELSWENGHAPIAKGDVLVIDEAGMLGTRQLARVSSKMQEIGAKLVLVGDPDQLQPIEAGTPFRDLVDIHGAARLTEIHRQRHDWQKQASKDLAEGNTAKALKTYRDKGSVTQTPDIDLAMEALVERYAMDALASGKPEAHLAFAHKRKDVNALNQAIRTAIRGSTAKDDVMFSTDTGKRAFGVGDRIVFGKNDKELGVKNGMLGTVQTARDGRLRVALDGDAKRSISFDPRRYQSFDHGYAVTIHKSQGATVENAYVLASRSMDKHLAYVAMTRHRDNLQVYSGADDAPKWVHQLDPVRRQSQSRSGPSLG